ncbi:MoaD/ThiS family protein [Persicobacter psychrovividus]
MIELRILTFGITREIVGCSPLIFKTEATDVGTLKAQLKEEYPAMKKLQSLAISVNQQYATDDQKIQAQDEIALIPPVAGG